MDTDKMFFRLPAVLLCAMLLLGATQLSIAAADDGDDSSIDISQVSVMDAYICDCWEYDGDGAFTIKRDVTVVGRNYDGRDLVFNIEDNSPEG